MIDMTYWCESCARKNNCYTIRNRPKCFTPITNTVHGTPESYLAKALRFSRDSHEIARAEPQTCEDCKHWDDTEDGCADRHGCKTAEDSSTVPTSSKMEQVDKDINVRSKEEPQTEMPRCSVNGTPFDECGFCEYFNCDTCKCEADVPQTERSE